MDPTVVLREADGHFAVLMYPGHVDPATALVEALAWLQAHGADGWALHEARTAARVLPAYWGGAALGFVGEDHAEAVSVTCVHLPGVALPRAGD